MPNEKFTAPDVNTKPDKSDLKALEAYLCVYGDPDNLLSTGMTQHLSLAAVHEEFKEYNEVKNIFSSFKDVYTDNIGVERAIERLTFILDEYQEQPHLLDRHLEELLNQLLETARAPDSPPPVTHLCFKALYLLTKVRGYKYVVRLMPHEVADFAPVLQLLEAQDPAHFLTWETRYVLLFWLGILSMIPFDLSRLDDTTDGDQKAGVMDRLLAQAQIYLEVADKSQDAAAFMASRFLSRIDVKQRRLRDFVTWALQKAASTDLTTVQGETQLCGLLRALGLMFKHGKRQELLPFADEVMTRMQDLGLRGTKNSKLRRLYTKIVQRIGLQHLPYRVAKWRYQRGSRSLAANLQQATQQQEGGGEPREDAPDDDDEEYDVPEQIEGVIEELLTSLKDSDTVVRWSAAKGVGRVTSRLPKELGDEVVGWLLDLFSHRESHGSWHGGCLALAELGRRGLLLPARLPDVMPVVLRALLYDDRHGSYSFGSHVRDAACYVCWAFARAYDPLTLQLYVTDIANALVEVTLFDREVNVRRAAAAAFQENVGRQGTFPHGIDILTTCDYFAVGNRPGCYLELSAYVAGFKEYTEALMGHLVADKVAHWDSVMRELCSKSLARLTPLAPEYTLKSVLPRLLQLATSVDLNERHGAVLAAAEVAAALTEVARSRNTSPHDLLGQDNVAQLTQIPAKLDKAQMFRGVSGELMRKAVCVLMERVAVSELPVEGATVWGLWQAILGDCLTHMDPDIRKIGAATVAAVRKHYWEGEEAATSRAELVARFCKELRSSSEQSRMGHALALSQFPVAMLREHFSAVVSGLMGATRVTGPHDKSWAEARSHALAALSRVFCACGEGEEGWRRCAPVLPELYDCLLMAMTDYTVDSRGDVGAWVREAGMTGLEAVTMMVISSHPQAWTPEMSEAVWLTLCQQAAEKIDRTRSLAGSTLFRLLYSSPAMSHIPHEEELKKIFPREECEHLNWAVEAATFPRVVKMLALPRLAPSVLLGLTVSVGGLTESLVKASWAALHKFLREADDALRHATATSLVTIFQQHQKDDRVSGPLLRVLDKLLGSGLLDDCPSDTVELFLSLTRTEVRNSKDPHKVLASIDVLCGMLTFSGEVYRRAQLQLLMFLCHPYPRVRKATSQRFYEAMLTYDTEVPDEILTLLSDTQWDDEVAKVRSVRNEMCDLLGVSRPVLKQTPK